ncbi:MAG: hypothetical protein SF051_07355 [Elusimicrobiota bacterium]|nr:hypothetical protein [Elusimicrobiota bacterium]
MPKRTLQPDLIADSAALLGRRVEERFPGSGLGKAVAELAAVAREAGAKADALARPLLPLRASVWALAAVLVAALVYAARGASMASTADSKLTDLLQAADAAVNLALLLGAAIYSLWNFEERLKRREALALLHELRALSHVVDMHQLTKDPATLRGRAGATASSPKRDMSAEDLGRYLDYCSEALALIGKVGAVYAQKVQDPVVLEAVDGIEDLSTGLARKVWQKIAILQGAASRGAA